MLLQTWLLLQALSLLLPSLAVGFAGSAEPRRFLQPAEGRGSVAQKKFVPDVAPVLLPSQVRLRGQFNPGARPLGQLNDHHDLPSSSDHSTFQVGRVAVIIVGMLRQFLEPQVQSTQHFLTDTLAAEHGEIDLFICVDTPNAAQLRKLSVGRVVPRAVFEHSFDGRHNQWPRMAACLSDVQATVGDGWSDYTWVVRSRPDNVFFAPVPPLKPLRTDTVYTRARRFGVRKLLVLSNVCLSCCILCLSDTVSAHRATLRLTTKPCHGGAQTDRPSVLRACCANSRRSCCIAGITVETVSQELSVARMRPGLRASCATAASLPHRLPHVCWLTTSSPIFPEFLPIHSSGQMQRRPQLSRGRTTKQRTRENCTTCAYV